MKKLIYVLVTILALSLIGCNKTPEPTPTPSPTFPIDIINIPDWVNSPEMIATWNRALGLKWVSDEMTTGYNNYYFTPIELTLSKIPDVNNPKRIIEKIPYNGDCDDMAHWNGYLSYVVMHADSYIIHFLMNGNIHVAHAITYGIVDGKYYFFDNMSYRGSWNSVEEFMTAKYPGYVIYFHKALKIVLEDLFNEGHLKYAPVSTSRKSKTKACNINGVCE